MVYIADLETAAGVWIFKWENKMFDQKVLRLDTPQKT